MSFRKKNFVSRPLILYQPVFTIFILIPWEYPYSSWVRTFALLSRAINWPSHTPTAYASHMVMRVRTQALDQSDHHTPLANEDA